MGEHGPPRVWLTFDDGPHQTNTDLMLSVLDKLNIRGTFFVVGRNAYSNPDVVRRTRDAGHRIGNHSYTHPHLSKLPAEEIAKEILATEALLRDDYHQDGLAGGPIKLLRPPYGDRNDSVAKVATRLGYYFCLWNVDPDDWNPHLQPTAWIEKAKQQITQRIADRTLTKDVVALLHDIHQTTSDHLADFVAMLTALGVTVQPPETIPFDLIPTVPPR